MHCPECTVKDARIAALEAQIAELQDVMGAVGKTLLSYKDRGQD